MQVCPAFEELEKKRNSYFLFKLSYKLGGIAGGILYLIAFSRTVIFSLRDKYKWASSPLWLAFYFIVIIAVGLETKTLMTSDYNSHKRF